MHLLANTLSSTFKTLYIRNPIKLLPSAILQVEANINFSPGFLQKFPNCSLFCHSSHLKSVLNFPGGSDSKASAYNVGDPGSIPGLGRSPGEGNGNLLQYSCLENPLDRGIW